MARCMHSSEHADPPTPSAPVNITFDPSRGQAPYDVIVAFSNFYAYQFQIPEDYAPMRQGLWSYPFLVPDLPADATSEVIVSLTDTNNVMSNSSRWQSVGAKTSPSQRGCAAPSADLDFIFYSQGLPQQCGSWTVIWNRTETSLGITPPLTLYFLPEMQPPLAISLNVTPRMLAEGAGNQTILLPIRAGTTFFYTLTDDGINVSGGVSQRNIVGLDENFANASCLDNAYVSAGADDKVPRPTTTIAPAGPTGLAYSYVTLTSATGSVSGTPATFVATQTMVRGTPLPGWNLTRIATPTNEGGTGSKLVIGVATSIGILVGMLLVGGIGWLCYRKRTKDRRRSGHITKWDAPNADRVDPNLPVHHGIYAGTAPYQRAATFDTLPGSDGDTRAFAASTRSGSGTGHAGPFSDEHAVRHSDNTELDDLSASRNSRNAAGRFRMSSLDLGDDAAQAQTWSAFPGQDTVSSEWGGSGSLYAVADGKPGQRVGPGATHRSPYSHAGSSPSSPADVALVSSNASFTNFPLLRNTETNTSSSGRRHRGPQESGTLGSRSASSGGGTNTNNARFVQHSDAGMLMDDELEAEVIDLPPQYDTISQAPRGGASDMRAAAQAYAAERLGQPPSGEGARSQQGLIAPSLIEALETGGTIDSQNSFARGRPLLDRLAGDGDEDEFWTSGDAARAAPRRQD